VKIVAVGFNTPEENQAWAEDQSYLYEIWSDVDKTLALTYGSVATSSAQYPGRVTRVLDAEGSLVLEYDVSNIGTHPADVLSDCRVLFGD